MFQTIEKLLPAVMISKSLRRSFSLSERVLTLGEIDLCEQSET